MTGRMLSRDIGERVPRRRQASLEEMLTKRFYVIVDQNRTWATI